MLICATRNVRREKKRSGYTILIVLVPALVCGIIMASLGVDRSNYDWIQRYTGGDILLHTRSLSDLNDATQGFTDDIQEEIINIDGIADIETNVIKFCSIFIEKENANKHNKLYREECYENAFMNLYYYDSFVGVGIENLSGGGSAIETSSTVELPSYGETIRETMNGTKEMMYPDVLHAIITEEQSELTGLKVGDYFVIVYSTWDDTLQTDISSVANVQVIDIVEHSLPYMFRFGGGFPHTYFDRDELREFTEHNGVNQIRINLTEDANYQQVLRDLYSVVGSDYWIETYHDLLTEYKASDAKALMIELITLLLTTIVIIVGCAIASFVGLINRKDEILTYHAVGIQKKEILRMTFHENMIYLKIMLPILLVCQSAFVVYNWYKYNQGSINKILVSSYLIIDLCIALFVILIGHICTKQMLKSNIALGN